MGGEDQTQPVQTTLQKVALKGKQKIGLSWRWSQRRFLSFLKQETRMCLRFKERSQPQEIEGNVESIILPSPGDLLEQSA